MSVGGAVTVNIRGLIGSAPGHNGSRNDALAGYQAPVDVSRRTGLWLLGALVAVSAALYCVDLGRTPVALGGDEAHFGVEADSIAQSGRDLTGHFLPLFVNLADPLGDQGDTAVTRRWYQPILFYVIALALKFLPLNEATVRLPMALIGGVLNPLLIYVVARRLFRSRLYAVLAALMLVSSPPLLILSREALDYVTPLAFVLGWLWCLLALIERRCVFTSLATGLVLGVGFYSYIAAWMLMPLFLLLTWVVQGRYAPASRLSIAIGVGFVLPLFPLVPWLWAHPTMLSDTFGRYGASGSGPSSPLQRATTFASVYASYFNPTFLFARGGLSMTTSTARAGVFLLPVALLLPVGLYDLIKRRRSDPMAFVLLAGLLLAPIPAALTGERRMIQRELAVIPFGVLLATWGCARLQQCSRRRVRVMVVPLLLVLPVQFAYVYVDYFTHYKRRSAFYYDPGAFRDAAEYVIAEDGGPPIPVVYLANDLDDVSARWRFYVTKHRRENLLQRTHYFRDDGNPGAPVFGSLMVLNAQSHNVTTLVNSGRWSIARTVFDFDRRAASVILRAR